MPAPVELSTADLPPSVAPARRPCPTLCARCACTARPASAAASPASGRCGTSPPTSTSRRVCARLATSAMPPTCPRDAFQEILGAVAADRLAFPRDRVYDGLEPG